jgi:hypothetical protein
MMNLDEIAEKLSKPSSQNLENEEIEIKEQEQQKEHAMN